MLDFNFDELPDMAKCRKCGILTAHFKLEHTDFFGNPIYVCDPECPPKPPTPSEKKDEERSTRKYRSVFSMVVLALLVMACSLSQFGADISAPPTRVIVATRIPTLTPVAELHSVLSGNFVANVMQRMLVDAKRSACYKYEYYHGRGACGAVK